MIFSNVKNIIIPEGTVKKISVGETAIWQSGRLPAGYTELEYIEANGTQYIDTGITGRDGLSVEMNIEVLGVLSADNSTLVGCTNSSSDRMYLTVNKSASPYAWELGAKDYYVRTYTNKFNTKYKINLDWNSSKSVLTVDGNAIITMTGTITFEDNGSNMFIFARNKGTSIDKYSHARLYDLKMWDGGALIRDFVPAKYNDATVGLYDLVSQSFFPNAGSGVFTAGAVV